MNTTHSSSQNGQSLIIIALMIVGIFGFLGLVLDGGQVFLTRRNSQDAADAAAFAGGRIVATHSVTATQQNVYDAITTFARANKVITDTDVAAIFIDGNNQSAGSVLNTTAAIPASATGVLVTATIRLQPYFIDLLIGNNPIPIQSVAAAQSGPPSIGSNLMPMSVYCDPQNPCNYTYGTIVRLFGAVSSSGGFQWLDYRQKIPGTNNWCGIDNYLWLYCSSGPVAADKPGFYVPYDPLNQPNPSPWIQSNTGVALAQTYDALDCWLFPNGYYNHGRDACWQQSNQGPKPKNRLWTIPVFDQHVASGNNSMYHNIMFAEFEFDAYYYDSQHCNWVGSPTNHSCDPATVPASFQNLFSLCANNNDKCIIGAFQKEVKSFQIKPGPCNTMGLDVCAYGLSQ